MNKIINGKRYNTATAEMVGEWSSDLSRTNFHWCEETLYRKRTGEFFIHGVGGPATQYSRYYDGCSYGDEKIIPLSQEEAREWAEEKLSTEEYEKIFEVADENYRVFTILFNQSMYDELKAEAEYQGTPIKDIILQRMEQNTIIEKLDAIKDKLREFLTAKPDKDYAEDISDMSYSKVRKLAEKVTKYDNEIERKAKEILDEIKHSNVAYLIKTKKESRKIFGNNGVYGIGNISSHKYSDDSILKAIINNIWGCELEREDKDEQQENKVD